MCLTLPSLLHLIHSSGFNPHLVTTDRGDLHLTKSIPELLARYNQAANGQAVARLIIDCEGMASGFLHHPVAQERIVVTILKPNQYFARFSESC